MIELLFYPILPFVFFPPLAFVVAGLFVWALWWRWREPFMRRFGIAMAVAAWGLFGVYECYMYYWSRTVIAPIRVDLLLLTPILYTVTIFGLVQAFMRRPSVSRSDRS
jgi:hypothetical protein